MGAVTIRNMAKEHLLGGVIRWERPPPVRHNTDGERDVNWQLVALQARRRAAEVDDPEDRWGVIREGVTTPQASSWQSRIVGGKVRIFQPAGSFEARIRLCDDGIRRFYVRYVGDLPQPAAGDDDQADDGQD